MNLFSLLKFIVNHPLNRADRIHALGRFARWQIASRLMNVTMAFPFVEQTRLFAKRGMTGATGNWYCGLHEPQDMAFVLHALRPDALFMDIGANIGSYSVLAAGGAGAKVIAVEPIPSTFENLQANVILNGLGSRIEVHCMGISEQPGMLRFTKDQDTVNHVLALGEISPYLDVPVTTVDNLCNGRVPTIIKIDVEGHEKSVLLGAAQTLGSPDILAVVMETNGSGSRYGVEDSELVSLMSGFGFSGLGYDPFSRTLLDRPSTGGNTIFLRDRATVQALLKSAKRYLLVNGDI